MPKNSRTSKNSHTKKVERTYTITFAHIELLCVLACLEAGGDRHGFKQLGEKLSKVKEEVRIFD
jgi:hypothetical protein